jgi:hypothetical protein
LFKIRLENPYSYEEPLCKIASRHDKNNIQFQGLFQERNGAERNGAGLFNTFVEIMKRGGGRWVWH